MPTTDVETIATENLAVDDQAEPTCAACGHVLEAHDPIGLRYCSATTAGAFERGCVCVGKTTAAAATP